ncbi:MAG: YigZ family protein [Halanaerobiaceae bacterium]|jgi:uncharacterized YigZ family protein|nr:YigZ family protein [Halanaerobiaceae bacterium]
MEEILYTPAKKIQVINKVKDSKFYGSISRADNEDEVKDFINGIKRMYHDATHNVSAYVLGSGDNALRYSDDDGEPAGSSGPPVLQAIMGAELTNTVIVVTRYFGGTKLGIGGLIRAYGDTARMAIAEAGRRKLELFYEMEVSINYQLFGTVMGQLEAFHAEILDTQYTNDGVIIKFLIEPARMERLHKVLVEKTSNKIQLKKNDYSYR